MQRVAGTLVSEAMFLLLYNPCMTISMFDVMSCIHVLLDDLISLNLCSHLLNLLVSQGFVHLAARLDGTLTNY